MRFVQQEEEKGRYILEWTAEDENEDAWEVVRHRLDTMFGNHEDRKQACTSSYECSLLELYIDDTVLDGEPHHLAVIWAIIRMRFEGGEAIGKGDFVGVQRKLKWDADSELCMPRPTQTTYGTSW